MPRLYPFRGHRFDPRIVGGLADVVTQPYDKISESLRLEYLERSPFNVAHLIANSDYEAAGRALRSWISKGALRRDEEPSLYAYQQSYIWESQQHERTGVIGLVSIREAAASIKGHEKTMSGPLQDRLHLLRETEVNDGLIFSLYEKPARRTDLILGEVVAGASPCIDVGDDSGFRHRLWRIEEQRIQQELNEILRPLTFYIADGHHRFQTAVDFMQECEEKGWKPGGVESFDKRMMALFNMASPGLRILATHRALRGLVDFSLQDFLAALALEFTVSPHDSVRELRRVLQRSPRTIGMIGGRPVRAYSVRPKEDSPSGLQGLTATSADLDVNLLHHGILEPLLGIGKAELAAQSHVDYFRDADAVAEGVQAGVYSLGFLLRPTTLKQVRRCSDEGIMMPQKSTDFFPKLLTGLVFSKMVIVKDP